MFLMWVYLKKDELLYIFILIGFFNDGNSVTGSYFDVDQFHNTTNLYRIKREGENGEYFRKK